MDKTSNSGLFESAGGFEPAEGRMCPKRKKKKKERKLKNKKIKKIKKIN
jgi:hypothetical protein